MRVPEVPIGDVTGSLKDLDQSIKGLNILLVEDIVDTGRTVQEVTKHCSIRVLMK